MILSLALLAFTIGCSLLTPSSFASEPLRMVVMDPLSKQLACACVQGFAQRDYQALATFMSEKMGRPVEMFVHESLAEAERVTDKKLDLIVGKQSVIRAEAADANIAITPLAMLTDREGKTTLTGLFIVRSDDPAKSIADLKGRKILFGPADCDEKHATALTMMKSLGLPLPAKLETLATCNQTGLAVLEKQADACVISSYAMTLLEGCGTIDKGALRVIGQTAPVPFITAFATSRVSVTDAAAITKALLAVGDNAQLKQKLETRDGFVPCPSSDSAGWTDWRGGPRRDAIRSDMPSKLPTQVRFLWRKKMESPAMAGIAVQPPFLIVADKTSGTKDDTWRCLDAGTGGQLWELTYPAPEEMDYTNTPRATPVIVGEKVYLLGAFGCLHCLELKSGRVLWKRDLLADFGGKLPTWGFCPSPMIDGDRLFTGTASTEAALVALDRHTGKLLWKTAGKPMAHAAMLLDVFGGRRQLIGYDIESIHGWDPETGRCLWSVTPEARDYNVPTPLKFGERLILSSENNATRLHAFNADATIRPQSVAQNDDLKPEISTPIIVNGLLFGVINDALLCLDPVNALATRWRFEDKAFNEYASLIGGNGRVLATTTTGELLLLAAEPQACRVISRLQVFQGQKRRSPDVWAHPALVGNRLYLRSPEEIVCLRLDEN
ncbi:MAG: PhnD/SsuA/transferrin family substrate-binding protein [Verrucomicrobia bacterium]|nr:PhnD/SsuA/transferrin family substrate-binding protein [Verrucomicrobiota bacterium]